MNIDKDGITFDDGTRLKAQYKRLKARIKDLEAALKNIEHDARLSSDPQRAHTCQISFDELLSGYGAIADEAKVALEGGDA